MALQTSPPLVVATDTVSNFNTHGLDVVLLNNTIQFVGIEEARIAGCAPCPPIPEQTTKYFWG